MACFAFSVYFLKVDAAEARSLQSLFTLGEEAGGVVSH